MNPAHWGVLAAVTACSIWGMAGLFFSLLTHVPPLELFAHRVVWACVFVGAFCIVTGRGPRIQEAFRSGAWRVLALSALLISSNWFFYLWAVQQGRFTEAGIGYYLMPLVSVLLGVVVLRERLSRLQWLAVAAAAVSVVMLTVGLGAAPWLPVLLASTFALYGLIRKRIATGAIVGFQVETMIIALPAAGWLFAVHFWGATWPAGRPGGLFGGDLATTLLLIVSGPATGLPLILFAEAARRLNYATTGLIQYINPSIQVAAAWLIFAEPFTPWHYGALALIWVGLALYSSEALRRERASSRAAIAAAGVSAKVK